MSLLFSLILLIVIAVFIAVEGALLIATWRAAHRVGTSAIAFNSNPNTEVAWTALPALILALLAVFTWSKMDSLGALPAADTLSVHAQGSASGWQFRYTDTNILTADELVVPVGALVEITVETTDTAREFWVPELFAKVEAQPNHATVVRFVATDVHATYTSGQCAPYCGHRIFDMPFVVSVKSPSDFQLWLTEHAPLAAQ